ncbi:hypothetical protein OE699_02575 [Sedimentimonas flavescens]|uniref:50S ribosome-binding GTPase n=1 Tax=Sedimentimonas flavescens TaxID=2851012 RepID=A0ABT2ZWP1_9RHOB|nr:hypothetical protein [Sedimentimonas flavescens]MCV2877725.1 hypothetical protein [Sedimentimonas flavescens]
MAPLEQIATQLQRALDRGALPPEGQSIGQRLLTHLNSPTRIAVIGHPGSGKSSLVNMLLGEQLMPDLGRVAALELWYGPAPRALFELPDGSVRAKDGLVDPAHIPAGTFRIRQELPDPRLRKRRFLELTLSEGGADQPALLEWMAKRTDIAIWCTQQFNDLERAAWAGVPDHLKDHSFLALTMADRLHMRGELGGRIAALQPVVAEEFLRLYPVATRQAIAAREAAEQTNEKLWSASGGKALFDGIQQQIDVARSADLDHVHILLDRYKVALDESKPEPAPKAEAAPAPKAQAAPERPAAPPKPRVDIADAVRRATQHDPKPEPARVIDRALALLQGCAQELIETPEATAGASSDAILERCSQAAEELVTLLSSSDDRSEEIEAFREDAIEGEQMLMLLRLERSENAAADALTVLVQMKKEMSERRAR